MSTAVAPAELVKTKAAAIKESSPIIQQAQALQVVDEDSYQQADHIRTTLKGAAKKWSDRLELIIRPARQALDSLYALNREITGPMEASVIITSNKMKAYKLAEAERLRVEEAKRVAEEAHIRREQEEAQAKLDAAKSKPVQRLMEQKIEKLEEKLEEVKEDVRVPVKAAGSGTRTVKVWEVSDMHKLLIAVLAGDIPEDVIEIKTVTMNDYFKGDTTPNKDAIRTWPGIKVRDEIQIVSKRGSL